ncbi:hypothetical protein MKW92_043237 [Papaver armeniacum]|nr:hypothetical protein MKW92_043237 [Papaver armeniacum]
MSDSDARIRYVFADYCKLREATAVVGWCIMNKYLFLLDNLRKEQKFHEHFICLGCLSGLCVGFLKGRHPLLEYVDFTTSLSKGSSLIQGISSR